MADEIDLTNDRMEKELAARIKAARSAPEPEPVTECINCGEPPKQRSRFCGKECRDDHEHRQLRLKRLGLT